MCLRPLYSEMRSGRRSLGGPSRSRTAIRRHFLGLGGLLGFACILTLRMGPYTNLYCSFRFRSCAITADRRHDFKTLQKDVRAGRYLPEQIQKLFQTSVGFISNDRTARVL